MLRIVINMNTKKVNWVLGTLAIGVTIISGTIALWPVIGWTTPNQHENDFVVAINEIREFRDEWKCDEYDEELLDLKEKLDIEKSSAMRVALRHEIKKIEIKMDKIDCSRFEDFG